MLSFYLEHKQKGIKKASGGVTAGGFVHLHVICQTVAYLSSSLIRFTIRSKRAFVRILAIKVITINKTIHTDTVIVVFTDAVTKRP